MAKRKKKERENIRQKIGIGRLDTPAPKIETPKSKYTRKEKHKKDFRLVYEF